MIRDAEPRFTFQFKFAIYIYVVFHFYLVSLHSHYPKSCAGRLAVFVLFLLPLILFIAMMLSHPVPVSWIARFIEATVVGNAALQATGINEIHKVQPGDISFVDNEKYYAKCLRSAATIIIINEQVEVPPGKVLLVCPDPFRAFVQLVKHFKPFVPQESLVAATAKIWKKFLAGTQRFSGEMVY